MNAKTSSEKAPSAGVDTLKWLVVLLLVAAAVIGNSYFSDQPFLYRLIGVLVASVVAALVASQTVKGQAFLDLLKGARAEVKRVVWPTRQETYQTTGVVVAVVAAMAVILWLLDMGLGKIIKSLVG